MWTGSASRVPIPSRRGSPFWWASRFPIPSFFSSRRRHTRCLSDWSSDVCSSDLFEQLFEFRQVVLHGAAAPLALDKIVHHAALNRPRAVQRIERGQILQPARLVAQQNVAHPLRFELEYAAGETLAKDFVGGGIVERQILGDDLHAVPLLDQ